jgi:hypothetical protein
LVFGIWHFVFGRVIRDFFTPLETFVRNHKHNILEIKC